MIERHTGESLAAFIPQIARLRIEVFADYPYLYDGDLDYEEKYLRRYIECPRAVVVIARDGDRVVGASTGLPLAEEDEAFKRPFLAAGYDVDRFFYCAESVLEKTYRGRGAGGRFFDEREAHARELGGFDWLCFCAVVRLDDHPARPADYRPLDAFWRRRGFEERPDLVTTYVWKDSGDEVQTPKKMKFWVKQAGAAF